MSVVKTEFDPNKFCLDDVIDYLKAKKKALKKSKKKDKKSTK